ncbi:hypothetical protein QN277_023841 [Acacia crassicarpa]|uniref:Benzyl alcohol O-benzoyltransferase n=1 Tax=Acacia crassicarpa TaxID=499986 RepID=A0AAE1MGR8_9FABA|nr:hypothetical protein QN277_023841 [Acacia crassicarpa]
MILQSSGCSPSLDFSVRRCQPELVAPGKPTPRELKLLSDIDSQAGLCFQIPFIMLYRRDPSMEGKDPVGIIRKALAETLVYYYPLAGRLREGDGRKLMVDCTAEGVLFVEADADVTLDQFGDLLHPPFPCFHELLQHFPASQPIINSPVLIVQVTRLKCGGFIMAIRLNHAVSDGPSLLQFLKALSEIAKGASQPSVLPVWHRQLLTARNPPRVTRIHHEYDEQDSHINPQFHPIFMSVPPQNIVQRSFFVRPSQIAALRGQLPSHLARSTTFDILTACLWRCRTIALQPPREAEVRLMSTVGLRSLLKTPLPLGYYGNSFLFPAVVSAAGKLMDNHFEYALEVIKKGRATVDQEHIQSLIDLTVAKGRPHHTTAGSFLVMNMTRAGFEDVDVGWGKAIYGGLANGFSTNVPEMTSNIMSSENSEGERFVVIPISLPAVAMEVFARELSEMLNGPHDPSISAPRIMSSI